MCCFFCASCVWSVFLRTINYTRREKREKNKKKGGRLLTGVFEFFLLFKNSNTKFSLSLAAFLNTGCF